MIKRRIDRATSIPSTSNSKKSPEIFTGIVSALVDNHDNNQCPNCGHRFSSMQMLFWGMSKISNCPDCKRELGVNKDRILLLWVIGILAIVALRLNLSMDSPGDWLALGIFIIVFALVAVRVQKLEIRK